MLDVEFARSLGDAFYMKSVFHIKHNYLLQKFTPRGTLVVHLGGQLVAFGAIMASWQSKGAQQEPKWAQCLILTDPRDPKMGAKMGLFFDLFLRCL